MKLSGLIDALIASGGTLDQVRAVVAAAEAAEDARRDAKRAGAAERQRRSRASRSSRVTECDGCDDPSPKEAPPDPLRNNPYPEKQTNTSPAAGSRIRSDWQPDPAGMAFAAEQGLGTERDHGRGRGIPGSLAASRRAPGRLGGRLARLGPQRADQAQAGEGRPTRSPRGATPDFGQPEGQHTLRTAIGSFPAGAASGWEVVARLRATDRGAWLCGAGGNGGECGGSLDEAAAVGPAGRGGRATSRLIAMDLAG